MLRITLFASLCLFSQSVFAAANDISSINLLFTTVVIICVILLLITVLLYFFTKSSASLWTTMLLALAGLAAVVTSSMMLRQCILENSRLPNNGFVICYLAIAITILSGFWAIGFARKRQKQISFGRGRHA